MFPIKARSLIFKDASDLNYQLKRSKKRKKTLTLQVERNGTIMMHVPYRTSEAETDRFFKQKEGWVRKKLKEMACLPEPRDTEKVFIPGENFHYLGEQFPLRVADSTSARAPLVLSYGIFLLREDNLAKARDVFVDWYKKRAREKITERVDYYSRQFNLPATGITITSALTRYGSCSVRNKVSFSWRLIMAPYPAIDYVILHELAHIKEKNHSSRFWDLLGTILPDYNKQRLWLRENGHLLRI
ncbi:MAG: M48 family peptidase [Syntrophus sp. (in: bacteria)]|nr:M48 family peptidase [Syntrophus sp. (in: bacteria)]